jgi:hypothetical protein
MRVTRLTDVLANNDGSILFPPIEDEITVSDYPIECTLVIQDTDSIGNFFPGPVLHIFSREGLATTYGLSTTVVGAATGTATGNDASATATNSDLDASQASATGSHTTAVSATSQVSAASTSTDAVDSSDSGSGGGGLSGGAAAGVAIGVILAVALIILGIFFFFRQRKRIEAIENELQETRKSQLDGSGMAAARTPATQNGGRMIMAETPNRGSAEWKAFFGSRAASAAGGTAPPSRLGTAKPPGPVPGRMSPASFGGDAGSTTGLVSNR